MIESSVPNRAEPKKWFCLVLPKTEYEQARDLQLRLVSARKDRILERDVVILLEHEPVFTLGRRGGLDHLLVDRAFLGARGIGLAHAERGGNITYHGPGQLVGYPIVNLGSFHIRVVELVAGLEEVMIRTAADWGMEAQRNPLNRGVWIGQAKLGSIGIAVRRGISYHGFALNVNTELEPFAWIHPCGLTGVKATSLRKELGWDIPMAEVKEAVKGHLEAVFGIGLAPIGLRELGHVLNSSGEGVSLEDNGQRI
jgi:lipoate-protein ligase B